MAVGPVARHRCGPMAQVVQFRSAPVGQDAPVVVERRPPETGPRAGDEQRRIAQRPRADRAVDLVEKDLKAAPADVDRCRALLHAQRAPPGRRDGRAALERERELGPGHLVTLAGPGRGMPERIADVEPVVGIRLWPRQHVGEGNQLAAAVRLDIGQRFAALQ